MLHNVDSRKGTRVGQFMNVLGPTHWLATRLWHNDLHMCTVSIRPPEGPACAICRLSGMHAAVTSAYAARQSCPCGM